MTGIGLWIVLALRLGFLSGERVFFHRLGHGANPVAAMVLAYGGAAGVLWLAAWGGNQAHWSNAAWWPSLIYAASFGCYTTSLALGPVSTVSAWANAVVVMMFLLQPVPHLLAWFGVAVFTGGMWVLMAGRRWSSGIWWMLAADGLLVGGRYLDAIHVRVTDPLAYAATLMTGVTCWMALTLLLNAGFGDTMDLFRERSRWALWAAVANAGSYLSLVILLRQLPPFIIEAASSLAGIGGTLLGVWWLREPHGPQKLLGAFCMTLGAIAVLSDHVGWFRVKW